ncbi:hypothetical protein llg_29450 [Luteolibacter sp. LG18]|nr:hypothetical protein llg_29450 [Luteolibacter sp. LG18]
MKRAFPSLLAACLWWISGGTSIAEEFRHVGDYLVKSRLKLTGEKATPIAIKPMLLHVYTDGIDIRVTAEGDEDARSTFSIYRSDGIGRQRTPGGALEVIPGLQATSNSGGLLRHLRLSRESLTITSFPGVSDQTIVTTAIGVEPTPENTSPPKQANVPKSEGAAPDAKSPRPESATR